MRNNPNPACDLDAIRREVRRLANPEQAEFLQRFFKTGPGEYAEGDRFLGIRVPQLRQLARSCRGLFIDHIAELLQSPWHEERLLALFALSERCKRGAADDRLRIREIYLSNTARINNWDLVDVSAEHIIGAQMDPANTAALETLARSEHLWERRIAMLATFYWIRRGVFGPALKIATLLRHDSHDLIHKAVGWMLREIGKRDREVEELFLRKHYRTMPRTTLRYAIERFPEDLRLQYLHGTLTNNPARAIPPKAGKRPKAAPGAD